MLISGSFEIESAIGFIIYSLQVPICNPIIGTYS